MTRALMAASAAIAIVMPDPVHARAPHPAVRPSSVRAGGEAVYPWTDGASYALIACPGLVSDILLQPGETLVSVAAGDTLRWVIGETSSGAGAAKRTHILLKPTALGLRTNLVITTDRRSYLVRLESRAGASPVVLSWTYAEDALLALRRRHDAAVATVAAVPVDGLNFDYRIDGDRPPWRPLRVFDDGTRVYIEFPPSLGTAEAPPLFVLGEHGVAELVNYRVHGHYYVVDRLFSAAELRLGQRKQTVVTIRRGAKRRHAGWPW